MNDYSMSGGLQEYQAAVNSLTRKSLIGAIDNAGWSKIYGGGGNPLSGSGISLSELKELSTELRNLLSYPWATRGAALRCAYIFGNGVTISGGSKRFDLLVSSPALAGTVFSPQAYETANLALFTEGNYFVSRNLETHALTVVPISQVTGVVTDPDDSSQVWYIQRTWVPDPVREPGKTNTLWIPVASFKRSRNGRIPGNITDHNQVSHPVSSKHVIYVRQATRVAGWTFGVPDSTAGAVWLQRYDSYLVDNVVLFKALSKFAWIITHKDAPRSQGASSAAEVSRPGSGGVASMNSGTTVSAAGVPSSQVNMNNGQPVIAAYATSIGVPVIALLSSPGAAGGSYNTAATLDTPTIKGFQADQRAWADFYLEILRDLPGGAKASIVFPQIEPDPIHRQVTGVLTAVELGVVHRDEARVRVLDLLGLDPLHDDLPPMPERTTGRAISGQGVKGVIPGGQQQGITDHELDNNG